VAAIGDFFSRHESSFVRHPRDDLAADADHVYFAPGSGGSGSGLYRYTLGGGAVERLADGLTGLSPSEVRGLTLFDDRLYFAATGDGGEAALHVWDPGPLRLTEVAGAPAPLDLLAAEDALYFVGQYGSTPADAALYALAPGGGSPVQVHDLAALGDVEGADLLQVLDGDLYLAIARSRTGAELYRFDPETGSLRAAGTTLPGAAGDLATTDSADAFVF
jgi:hypothetical protein